MVVGSEDDNGQDGDGKVTLSDNPRSSDSDTSPTSQPIQTSEPDDATMLDAQDDISRDPGDPQATQSNQCQLVQLSTGGAPDPKLLGPHPASKPKSQNQWLSTIAVELFQLIAEYLTKRTLKELAAMRKDLEGRSQKFLHEDLVLSLVRVGTDHPMMRTYKPWMKFVHSVKFFAPAHTTFLQQPDRVNDGNESAKRLFRWLPENSLHTFATPMAMAMRASTIMTLVARNRGLKRFSAGYLDFPSANVAK